MGLILFDTEVVNKKINIMENLVIDHVLNSNHQHITEQPYKDIIENLQKEGDRFFEYRVIPGLGLCALHEYLFTVGLVVSLDSVGYSRRYCYPRDLKSVSSAVNDILDWDGVDHPKGNWIKCKGDLGDIENPNFNQFL